jgi:hypothetical protein
MAIWQWGRPKITKTSPTATFRDNFQITPPPVIQTNHVDLKKRQAGQLAGYLVVGEADGTTNCTFGTILTITS